MSVRATWHPSVPAPRRRHLIPDRRVKSKEGRARHLINFKFKSAADSANLRILTERNYEMEIPVRTSTPTIEK